VIDRESARKGESVLEIIASAPTEPESPRNASSSRYNRLQPKPGRALSCVSICPLKSWCTVLLIIMSCGLPFALSSCGGSIIASGASSGALVASSNSVTFGSVQIGQTANTTVSLLNKGASAVQIAQLDLSGQPFSLVGSSSLPVTVAAGASYTLNVQFNPIAAGTATGQLTIASNSSTSATPVITLSGTGTTGTGTAALSALYCSSGAMTGSGTDACTVTLTAAAPGDGLTVNLSSSSSAVTVPSTVIVPANATSAGFTATVSSVAAAQAVTMTASAGSVMKNFTLQLNAAIIALSINATSVAFGEVPVDTTSTQAVTLTSTGTVPVTISGATLTGAGFTLSGTGFPTTLSPNQEATLNIAFDPTAAGAATGQVTITGNSSTNGTAVIGLSGTGIVPQVVAVAVTPATASVTNGSVQQFAASVTGTFNTAVTWTASGTGCTGAACGTISPSGLYTAPATAPSPATATITAASQADPTKSASATVTIVPIAGATYYLAPAGAGGNDSNNGLSSSTPWLSPNHPVNCGDVIVAAASASYSAANFTTGKWGTVACAAGNNVAWLKCVTFDACKIITNSAPGPADIQVDHSYWGVEGWEVQDTGSPYAACFGAFSPSGSPVQISHVIFANNVANGCQISGFSSANEDNLVSADYLVIIGNIAYNTDQGSVVCGGGGISIYQPVASDSLPGTHIYIAGNFSYGNVDADPCAGGTPTDGEGVNLDSLSGLNTKGLSPYSQQVVVDNNMMIFNGSSGFVTGGTGNSSAPIYLRHNTLYGNSTDSHQNNGACGQLLLEGYPGDAANVVNLTQVYLNLAEPSGATEPGCGSNPAYAYYVYNASSTDNVYQNSGYSVAGNNTGSSSSSGFSFGPGNVFGVNPSFTNPAPPGPPNCTNSLSVPACMASVIANFTPTNSAVVGYGYQIPSPNQDYDLLFPQWLCNVSLPSGLVTMGCKTAP